MPNTTELPVTVTKQGVGVSWPNIWQMLRWSAPFALAAIVSYLHTTYATHEEVNTVATQVVAPLKVEISSLQVSTRQQELENISHHDFKNELERHQAIIEKLTSDHDMLLRIDENSKQVRDDIKELKREIARNRVIDNRAEK